MRAGHGTAKKKELEAGQALCLLSFVPSRARDRAARAAAGFLALEHRFDVQLVKATGSILPLQIQILEPQVDLNNRGAMHDCMFLLPSPCGAWSVSDTLSKYSMQPPC